MGRLAHDSLLLPAPTGGKASAAPSAGERSGAAAGARLVWSLELTGREWQVIGLLAQSLTREEVAQRLGEDVVRIDRHCVLALAKLRHSRGIDAAALRRSLEHKLVYADGGLPDSGSGTCPRTSPG